MEFLIKEFGFPIAMATALVGTFIWLAKTLIGHFISQMNAATEERKAMTIRFAETVENHITHNTKTLKGLCDHMCESRSEHTEMIRILEGIKNR